MTRKLATVLAAIAVAVTLGATPAEAKSKGKHKGWISVAVCSGGGAQPFTPAGGASCPLGLEATIVKVRRQR